MALHFLGPFRFRNWRGAPPQRIRQTTEVLSHPGADYEMVRFVGKKSGSVQRDTIVDVASFAMGMALFGQYQNLIGADPQKLIWNNYDYDIDGMRAIVLDCEKVELRQNLLICNPITPGYTVDLVARWTFLLSPI